jgi:hypothetical protein
MSLWATKSITALRAQADEVGAHSLKRSLGPLNLTTLGIGAIIGAGIFVLTGQAAALHAGPAWSAAAWPVRTKMPAPMMAPMPRVVRFSGPRDRFSECSPTSSACARSAATDLVAHRLMSRSPVRGTNRVR